MPRRSATNRIQQALDALGIDWHSPRYGRPRLPARADVLFIPDNGAFGNLAHPLTADGSITLDMRAPPARLSARARVTRSMLRGATRATVEAAAARLVQEIGRPAETRIGDRLAFRWDDQGGWISMSAPHGPDRHCSIDIAPGWRRPVDAAEAELLVNMRPIGRGARRGVRAMISATPTDADAGFIREPFGEPSAIDGILAVTGGMLVASPGRLLVIPLDAIREPRLTIGEEGTPSTITMSLANGAQIAVAEHDEPHGLDLVMLGLTKALAGIPRNDAVTS